MIREKSVKENILSAMREIASQWECRHVAVIICTESGVTNMQSVYGFNDDSGIGTVLYMSATAEAINHLLSTAWSKCVYDKKIKNNGK